MVSLDKRLTALEQQAHDGRTRQLAGQLAAQHGIDPEELYRELSTLEADVARLRAQGIGERQVLEHLAAHAGVTAEQLEAEAERLAADAAGDDEC